MAKYLIIGEEHGTSLATGILLGVTQANVKASIHLEIDSMNNIRKLWEVGTDELENVKRMSVFENLPKILCHTNDLNSMDNRYSTNQGDRDYYIGVGLVKDKNEQKILLIGHAHISGIVNGLIERKVSLSDIKVFVPKTDKVKLYKGSLDFVEKTSGYIYDSENIKIAIEIANNHLQEKK
jgi:hypothetical protein